MRDVVLQLLATDIALDKLGVRDISAEEAAQMVRNLHAVIRNPRSSDPGSRRLLVGRTDGGRILTLVIEETIEPTTWLVVTGWPSTATERRIVS